MLSAGHCRRLGPQNWIFTCSRMPPGSMDCSRAGRLDELLPHLAGLRVPYLDVEALVRPPRGCPMCDCDPLPWWGCRRVSLIGDAAHPMYPMDSNGAAQAILDARCLARLLAERPAEEALRSYERLRLPPTTEVVHSNRRGAGGHPSHRFRLLQRRVRATCPVPICAPLTVTRAPPSSTPARPAPRSTTPL
jgi:2-polyprenyl-6-methoxyphenol hydroxylase-like FAD-dependent oxidoreductase